jgi:hypothetical protein
VTQRLFMELKVGQSLTIDENTVITLESKSGQLARLKVEHQGAKVAYAGPERRKSPRPADPKAA